MQPLLDTGSIVSLAGIAQGNISTIGNFINTGGIGIFFMLLAAVAIVGLMRGLFEAGYMTVRDTVSSIFK